MKMKKWLKCLLTTTVFTGSDEVGAVTTTIPAARKAEAETVRKWQVYADCEQD